MPKSDRDEFYAQYGKALAAWADLEGALCRCFTRIIEPGGDGEVNGDGIFYSARSFNGRAEMLKAATASRNLTEGRRNFVRKAIKKAGEYNKFRAKLAHRITIEKYGFGPDEDGFALYEGSDTLGRNKESPPIQVGHLLSATTNFDALSWLIDVAFFDSDACYDEFINLIDRFPKDPHLGVDDTLIDQIYSPRS